MTYYHCSPTAGLTTLEPRKPDAFQKPRCVYMTTLLPMALMYGVRNFEYTYGYTKEGQIYYDEYFPDALEILYKGKSASLYRCTPAHVSTTKIPNEATSEESVPVVDEVAIPDIYEALLEQERLGALVIRRYEELSGKMLDWIRRVEADEIREHDLLHTGGPHAEYMKTHYPESWAIVEEEERKLLYHGSPVAGLTELQPFSKLHQSEQTVVYLSSGFPYVLLYIWDAEKTGSSRKWVTAWAKDGITYYEEQFPGQLRAFYEGVSGYVYSVLPDESVQTVPQREDLFFSTAPVKIYRAQVISDVYQALLQYEREGKFQLLRFEDAAPEKQEELIDRIAVYIRDNDLTEQDSEHSRFMKKHFVDAWNKAQGARQ